MCLPVVIFTRVSSSYDLRGWRCVMLKIRSCSSIHIDVCPSVILSPLFPSQSRSLLKVRFLFLFFVIGPTVVF